MATNIQYLNTIGFLWLLVACDSPEQKLANEKQEAFENKSAHYFVMEKDAAETMSNRPLNSVEERGIWRNAHNSAKIEVDREFYDREQSLARISTSSIPPPQSAAAQILTKAEQVELIKHEILGEDKNGHACNVILCESEHKEFLVKASTSEEILIQSKWMLEDAIKKEKIRHRDRWSMKDVPLKNRAMVRSFDANMSPEGRALVNNGHLERIREQENILTRVIALTGSK